jgi:hypothetical protein
MADTTAAPAAARERSAKPMSRSAAGAGGGGGPDPEACSMTPDTVRGQGRNRNLAAGRAKEGRKNRAAAEEVAREGKGRRAEQNRWTWLGSAPLLACTFQEKKRLVWHPLARATPPATCLLRCLPACIAAAPVRKGLQWLQRCKVNVMVTKSDKLEVNKMTLLGTCTAGICLADRDQQGI